MTQHQRNIEVIDSQVNGGVSVEVLAYKQLDGAQRLVDAQSLFFAEQSGVRLKQIRVTLKDNAVVLESGALQFMHGQLAIESPGGDGVGTNGDMANATAFVGPTVTGSGVVYLEPSPSAFLIKHLNNQDLVVHHGIFYCCEKSVEVGHTIRQTTLQTRISGSGLCVLVSPVPENEIRRIRLQDETLQVVDSLALLHSAGLDLEIIDTPTGGEGPVQTFRGTGEVWLAPTKPVYDALNPERVSRAASVIADLLTSD